MSDLEELIRDIVARGELTHFSLIPRKIDIGNNKFADGWSATVAPASSQGNTFAESTDPVEAMMTALSEVKKRRRSPGTAPPPKASVPKAGANVDLSDLGL